MSALSVIDRYSTHTHFCTRHCNTIAFKSILELYKLSRGKVHRSPVYHIEPNHSASLQNIYVTATCTNRWGFWAVIATREWALLLKKTTLCRIPIAPVFLLRMCLQQSQNVEAIWARKVGAHDESCMSYNTRMDSLLHLRGESLWNKFDLFSIVSVLLHGSFLADKLRSDISAQFLRDAFFIGY